MQLLSLQGSNHGYCVGSPLVNKGMMMGGIYTGHGGHSHHGFHTADVVVTAIYTLDNSLRIFTHMKGNRSSNPKPHML